MLWLNRWRLRSMQAETRRRAAESLGRSKNPGATALLVGALTDSDAQVRTAVAAALEATGWDPPDERQRALYVVARRDWEAASSLGGVAVSALAVAIQGDDREVGTQAARALASMRRENAIGPFLALMAAQKGVIAVNTPAGKERVRRERLLMSAVDQAVRGMGASAMDPLLLAIKERQDGYESAGVILRNIVDRACAPALCTALAGTDTAVRSAAREALEKLGLEAVEALVGALLLPDAGARSQAVSLLQKLERTGAVWEKTPDARRAIPRLIAGLVHLSGDAGKAASEALQRIDPQWLESAEAREAVPVLCETLSHAAPDVRQAAAKALARLRDGRSIGPLAQLLADPAQRVRSAAEKALTEIDPDWPSSAAAKAVAPGLIQAIGSADAGVRRAAEAALERMDPGWAASDAAAGTAAELVAKLRDAQEDVRAGAAAALGRIGDRHAFSGLVACLEDRDWKVRQSSRKALVALGWSPESDREETLAAIADENWVLAAAKGEAAVPHLIHVLRHFQNHCSEAAGALQAIGSPAVEPLLEAFARLRSWQRVPVAEALGLLGDVRAVDALVRVLEHPAPDETPPVPLLATVCEALGQILGRKSQVVSEERVAAALERLIAAGTESAAIGVLVQIRGAAAASTLKKALDHSDHGFRLSAAKALTRVVERDPGRLPTDLLIELSALGDIRYEVREQTDCGMHHSTHRTDLDCAPLRQRAKQELIRRGAPALQGALKHPSAEVRVWVADALGKIGDSSAAASLQNVLEDQNGEVRRLAAAALGRIGDVTAVRKLIAALGDPIADVRAEAAGALGLLGDARAVERLAEVASGDKMPAVRCEAVRAVGRLGLERAMPTLLYAIEDPATEVKLAALESLGSVSHPHATMRLKHVLRGSSDLRVAAARALARSGPGGIHALLTALDDTNPGVHDAARLALQKIDIDAEGIDQL